MTLYVTNKFAPHHLHIQYQTGAWPDQGPESQPFFLSTFNLTTTYPTYRLPTETQLTETMDDDRIETTIEQLHFDVAATPSHMRVEDPMDQSVTLAAACLDQAFQRDEAERFHNQSTKRKALVYFADLYNRKDSYTAMRMLTHRTQISLDGSEFVTRHDDEALAWEVESHFLDLHICVGDGLGLAAMLPNIGVHHAIEFRLELQYRMRRFQAKYAKLGFDPTNSMLWIGRSALGEDAWIAWVPTNALDASDEDIGLGSGKEDTTLSQKHYRMTVMFLAAMLCRIGHRDIIVPTQYPNVTDDDEYEHATNLM